MPALDPGCVKTFTEQKSVESYSHTPPVHDLFDTLYQNRMTCAVRQKCGNYGVFEFSGVGRRWGIVILAREGPRTFGVLERHSTALQRARVFARPRPTSELAIAMQQSAERPVAII